MMSADASGSNESLYTSADDSEDKEEDKGRQCGQLMDNVDISADFSTAVERPAYLTGSSEHFLRFYSD